MRESESPTSCNFWKKITIFVLCNKISKLFANTGRDLDVETVERQSRLIDRELEFEIQLKAGTRDVVLSSTATKIPGSENIVLD